MRLHAVAGSEVTGLNVTAAYNAIAAGYDGQVSGDDWMRRALHAHYARVLLPGQRVLDVGCGTGIDALALARRGIRVLGIDGSVEMVAHFSRRMEAAGVTDLATARVLRIEALETLRGERFDALISAFASLSSLPDLSTFARDAAALVRGGGRLILHLLNRFSLWEWLGYVRRGDWPAARRMGHQRRRSFVIGGQSVRHSLYAPHEAYGWFFRSDFMLQRAYGLGAVRPPHTVRRLPTSVTRVLEWIDVRSGHWPLVRDAGRFFVLDLERRSIEPQARQNDDRA